jgi:HK97 family phage major capsid protein
MSTEQKKVEFTQEELNKTIVDAIKGMEFPEILALKEEMKRVERAALFPAAGDDGILETCGKSIVDTSVFYKKGHERYGDNMDAAMLARRVRSGSTGPWLSLSPTMERFTQILRKRGDSNNLIASGFDLKEYNKEVLGQIEKATGPLTITDVGALVPIEFLATVIEFATAQSQILPRVWRLPMGSLTLRIPRLAQAAGSYFGGIKLYHPDEAAEKEKTKPTFDYLTFTAKKLIGLISLTDELIADSSINIINYVTSLFVRAFQWETEHEIVQGLGTGNQMLGILNDPGINVVSRQALGSVQYEDLVNLDSALDENFTNLTYITRKATANTLRLQKDTVGQPVYHDGMQTFLGGRMPATLLGEPVVKTRNAKPMGATGDVILGDLGFYIWAVRQDMTIDQSRDRYFEYDETAIRFVVRQDGAPAVPIAFAVLDQAIS